MFSGFKTLLTAFRLQFCGDRIHIPPSGTYVDRDKCRKHGHRASERLDATECSP